MFAYSFKAIFNLLKIFMCNMFKVCMHCGVMNKTIYQFLPVQSYLYIVWKHMFWCVYTLHKIGFF